MYFLIGADCVPTKTNAASFENGYMAQLLGDKLYNLVRNAQFRIFNLEAPLTRSNNNIIKCGPCLKASPNTINGYVDIKTDLLTLANNHIMDYGNDGLKSTIELLDNYGIRHLGAGKNLDAAKKPYFFSFGLKTVGVFACCEHEFSSADEDNPGANTFDPLSSLEDIFEIKKKCDYLIVLYHGGKEHYRYPSPYLQRVCRKMVDSGANLVVCQHSHCVGCEERYRDSIIIYGQGNFCFDLNDNDMWKTGLLISINERFEPSYIPLVKNNENVGLAIDNLGDEIIKDFYKRSEEIKEVGFIEKKYSEFAKENEFFYLNAFHGINKNFFFRVVNKISGDRFNKYLLQKRYRKEAKIRIINYVECEAHRELLLKAIRENI